MAINSMKYFTHVSSFHTVFWIIWHNIMFSCMDSFVLCLFSMWYQGLASIRSFLCIWRYWFVWCQYCVQHFNNIPNSSFINHHLADAWFEVNRSIYPRAEFHFCKHNFILTLVLIKVHTCVNMQISHSSILMLQNKWQSTLWPIPTPASVNVDVLLNDCEWQFSYILLNSWTNT